MKVGFEKDNYVLNMTFYIILVSGEYDTFLSMLLVAVLWDSISKNIQ